MDQEVKTSTAQERTNALRASKKAEPVTVHEEVIDAKTGEITELKSTETDLMVNPETIDLKSADAFDFMSAEDLEEMETTISIVPHYYKFNVVGEKTRGRFYGFAEITKKVPDGYRQIPVVVWVDTVGNMFMNGGVALIDKFEGMKKGQPFEIELVKAESEKAKVYDVRLLRSKSA